MHSDLRTLDALLDARDNIRLAQAFVEDLTIETFAASRLHLYAVTRALEIISEATRRFPEELRKRHAHLPWRAIRDSGNFYRHQYDSVSESQVWITVRERLPALLAVVEAEIALRESS